MPKLDIKGTPIASDQTHTSIQRGLDVVAEVKAQLAAEGLEPYPRPKITPEPLDTDLLTRATNRELEPMLITYTAYAAYLQTKLAEAQVGYAGSKVALKKIAAGLRASLFKDRVPKQEVEARVQNAPEYIEYEIEELKMYATREILEAHYNAYSKQAQAVSRTIELRKLEYEQEMRQNSVRNYRPGGAPMPPPLKRR